MVNYVVQPDLLRAHLPAGLELDAWNGRTYVSMVGFLFLRTKVFGVAVPLHVNFEEVNLRFYVRRKAPEGWRRGVVFIKEIVPRRLIANVARVCYNEPYVALPMRHRLDLENGALKSGSVVEFGWRLRGQWNALQATVSGVPQLAAEGSLEEFITEHYWGYTAQANGGCKEYAVEHERWKIWPARDPLFKCDVATLYGKKFEKPLSGAPESAFVAEGSPVVVRAGAALPSQPSRKPERDR